MSTIHIAALEGDLKRIKELLTTNPLLVNQKNPLGFTPLHLAARYGHLPVVKFLVEKNACLEIKNHKGETPAEVTRSPKIGKYIQTCADKHNKSCPSHRLHHEMLDSMEQALAGKERECMELKAIKNYYEEQTRQLKEELSKILTYCQDYNTKLSAASTSTSPAPILELTIFQNMLQSHINSHPPKAFIPPPVAPTEPTTPNTPSLLNSEGTGSNSPSYHNPLKKEGSTGNLTGKTNTSFFSRISSFVSSVSTTPSEPARASSPKSPSSAQRITSSNAGSGNNSPISASPPTGNLPIKESPLFRSAQKEELLKQEEEEELQKDISEFEHADALAHENIVAAAEEEMAKSKFSEFDHADFAFSQTGLAMKEQIKRLQLKIDSSSDKIAIRIIENVPAVEKNEEKDDKLNPEEPKVVLEGIPEITANGDSEKDASPGKKHVTWASFPIETTI